jgi:hypothetical protein
MGHDQRWIGGAIFAYRRSEHSSPYAIKSWFEYRTNSISIADDRTDLFAVTWYTTVYRSE